MKYKKGFTLLIAIVVTAVFLVISMVVVNLALKQIVLNYSTQESQYAYYNAESGIECAIYWDAKAGGVSAFDPSISTTSPSCYNQSFSSGGTPISSFNLNLIKGCVNVTVDKSGSGTTIYSRGYDDCSGSAYRKFERGITVTY